MSAITKVALLFANPYNRPLSTSAQFQAGCYLVFTANGVIAPVYRDPALTWPYNQTLIPGSGPPSEDSVTSGVVADATGRFDPIYLNPALQYSYTLYSAAGVVLETGTNVNVANTLQTLEAVKISSTSRIGVAGVINDPDLQIAIPASSSTTTYRVEADLAFTANSSSDTTIPAYFYLAYSGTIVSAGPGVLTYYGYAGNAAYFNLAAVNTQSTLTLTVAVLQNSVKVVGIIQVAEGSISQGGTLSIKWGVDASAGDDTVITLNAGSALYATTL